MKPRNVLFFCQGNTCRSPLAEALARKLDRGQGVQFLSAGLHAVAGMPASVGSQSAAEELGVSLASFSSRPLDDDLVAGADWVIGMTWHQVDSFRRRFPDFAGRTGLIGRPGVDLSASDAAPGGEEVGDPFGGSLETYRAMAAALQRLLEGWRPVFWPDSSPDQEET